MINNKKIDTGTIGEYYTLCELWRNGFNAIKSDSPLENGWDILVLNDNSDTIKYRLQVKCLNWEVKEGTSRTVNVDIEKNFNFLVLVILNKEEDYQLFVIPKAKLRAKRQGERNQLFGKKDNCLLCSKKNLSIETLKRQDRWEKFCKYKNDWPE
ncbi:hypothetical protein [Kurthia gibsonii]|uniref:hypothetical protein n=1 Tax=Kurthia gibsonii TaxID=33946 RepID=UPI00301A1295